ncbi:MAG: hypothetical protein H0W76_05040 [Pyrinomonadaceae bacterium]|nr:hypothetical protein [Pyrinomonadaceae bacterium]
MKGGILIVLLAVAAGLAMTTEFTQNHRIMQGAGSKLNIKDLSEHGLKIIGPSDPSYDNVASALFPETQSAALQALRPYSVILKNTSDRIIIACRLKWEFTEASGRVKTEPRGFITFGPFMGLGAANTDPNTNSNIIKSNSTWLFTPSIMDVRYMKTDGSVGGNNAARMHAEYLQTLAAKLVQYTSITVSLDGVFFDDGTFVGPDETNFFAYVEALQKARHDVFREVESGIKQGKIATELLNHISRLAEAPEVRLSSASTSSDFYNFQRKIVAKEVLKVRKKAGNEQAIKFSVEQISKPWLDLRKR